MDSSCVKCGKKCVDARTISRCRDCSNVFHKSCAKRAGGVLQIDAEWNFVACGKHAISALTMSAPVGDSKSAPVSPLASFVAPLDRAALENIVSSVVAEHVGSLRRDLVSLFAGPDSVVTLRAEIESLKIENAKLREGLESSRCASCQHDRDTRSVGELSQPIKVVVPQSVTAEEAVLSLPLSDISKSSSVSAGVGISDGITIALPVPKRSKNKSRSAKAGTAGSSSDATRGDLTSRVDVGCDQVNSASPLLDDGSCLESEWKTVNRVRRGGAGKRSGSSGRSVIVGTGTDNSIIEAVPRKAFLFVSRLAPTTVPDDLVLLLKSNFPEVECTSLVSRYPESYSSFRIAINFNNLDAALVAHLWPRGAIVKRYWKSSMTGGENKRNFPTVPKAAPLG